MVMKTAYVTGAASGIGREVTRMLAKRGIRVAAADMNLDGVKALAQELNSEQNANNLVTAYQVNIGDWDSQLSVFKQALENLDGRIDYVYPIAGVGENMHLPNNPDAQDFVKPDLKTLDIDLTGFIQTSSLAIQQFRRQEKDEDGLRGKIATVASVCGFYCAPTLPIYTAAKHGVVGYVRSFGKHLPEEGITLNAVCPNVVRTGISTETFYKMIDAKGLLTPMEDTIKVFENFLDSDISGECIEVGPKGKTRRRAPAEHLDKESAEIMQMLHERGRPLHQPKSVLPVN